MSNINIDRSFVKPLIRTLDQDTRKLVERQSGQLLLLDDVNAFTKVLEATLGVRVPPGVQIKALEAGRARAAQLQSRYIATKAGSRKYKVVQERAKTVLAGRNLVWGQNAFIVTSFGSSIPKVKDTILNSILTDIGQIDNPNAEEARAQVHRGHGVEGLAVSQVQLARAFNKAAGLAGGSVDIELFKDNLNAFIDKAELTESTESKYKHQIDQLSTNYVQQVSKAGKLKNQYFSIVTFQDAADNQSDAVLEKGLVTIFRKFVNTEFAPILTDLEHSTSLRDKVASHIFHEMTDDIVKEKNVRTKWDEKLKLGTISKGLVEERLPKNEKPTIKKYARGSIVRKRKARPSSSAASQALNLIVLINQKLPETVRRNMGTPALVNRTGRFAASTRVTDVATTPQGYPSIGYTYQRNPYQVFEMGVGSPPWATPDRDPRKIIDKSIREIAAQYAIGRFYTRRV